VDRTINTGLPNEAASSWMPPESVMMKWQRLCRRRQSAYPIGGPSEIRGMMLGYLHADFRIRVNGKHDAHVGKLGDDRAECGANLREVAVVLAPMHGREDHSLARKVDVVQHGVVEGGCRIEAQQCIDHGVAGDDDAVFVDAFEQQILFGAMRGREMQ
jgi:hypothetical protein